MAEKAITSGVRDWYTKLNDETFAKARLNEEQLTKQQIAVFDSLSEETRKRYWGTGMVIPENVQGKRILDIGCGAGNLVFILSKLVGPTGYVIGIDLTDRAIQTAKEQSEYHWKQWGYDKPNFEFRVLNADHLEETFPEEEFDLIVSNGVIGLIPDKERLYKAAYKLLKPGGQFFLNDQLAEKEAPEELKDDVNLWSWGTTGTIQYDTMVAITRAAGFTTPHLTSLAPWYVGNEEVNAKLEYRRYVCASWRLFKLDPSRAKGDHKGPALVTYNGGITDYPVAFPWDADLTFKKGEGVEVDEELATLLSSIYLSDCFSFKPASGHPVTRRGQNPFQLMDKMEAEGKLPEPICTLK